MRSKIKVKLAIMLKSYQHTVAIYCLSAGRDCPFPHHSKDEHIWEPSPVMQLLLVILTSNDLFISWTGHLSFKPVNGVLTGLVIVRHCVFQNFLG